MVAPTKKVSVLETAVNDDPPCGLDVALAVMGGKWKPLILFHLHAGPRRLRAPKRRVAGVSEKVLIQHLRELVADGVLTRRDHGGCLRLWTTPSPRSA